MSEGCEWEVTGDFHYSPGRTSHPHCRHPWNSNSGDDGGTHQLTPGAGGGSPPHGGHSSWAHLRNAVKKRRLGWAGPGEGRGDQGLRPTIFAPAFPAGYSPWRPERSAGPPLRIH